MSLYTEEYVGLTLADAEALASSYGLESRVVRADGRDLAVFGNLVTRRVDFAVEDGVVTRASYG